MKNLIIFLFLISNLTNINSQVYFNIDPFTAKGYIEYNEDVVKVDIEFDVVYNDTLKEWFTDSTYTETAIRLARRQFKNIVDSSKEQLKAYTIYDKLSNEIVRLKKPISKDINIISDLQNIQSKLDEEQDIKDIIGSITKNRLGSLIEYLLIKDN
jgi:hypothetical protein